MSTYFVYNGFMGNSPVQAELQYRVFGDKWALEFENFCFWYCLENKVLLDTKELEKLWLDIKREEFIKLRSEQYHMMDLIELYPINTYLENATGLCNTQVKRILKELENQGLISHNILSAAKFAKIPDGIKALEITIKDME